ncbi:hypothetical protein PG993_013273 [Apiospora rasikravindrae]|uniref:Capsule polysaccharide biosynthesis protein n=1 Tax=Apiospora rasikravindrae TaxID=990691 RepID=A0ABR1RYS6_9PEZI
MDRITAIQRFLGERGLPLPEALPESVLALAQHLRLSSYWELAGLASVLGFAVANLKALPLAHSLRLLPSLSCLLAPRLFGRKGGSKKKTASDVTSSSSPAARPALFRHHTHSSRAIPLDLDINMHKSNSTFFADADISRAALLTSMLSGALAARGTLFVLAGTQCKFLREIRPLQAYAVASQVQTWTDKAFYTVTYFVSPRRGDAAAVCGLKGRAGGGFEGPGAAEEGYVFKAGRATVEPAEVFSAAGLLLANGGKDVFGVKSGKKEEVMSAGEVEKVVQEGMQFVRDCML